MSLLDVLPQVCYDMGASATDIRARIQYETVENVMVLLHEQAGGLAESVLTARPVRPQTVQRFGAYMLAALDRYSALPVPGVYEMRLRAEALIPRYAGTGVPITHPAVADRLILETVAGWAAYTCASPVTWQTAVPSIKETFYGKTPLLLGLLTYSPVGNIENVMF